MGVGLALQASTAIGYTVCGCHCRCDGGRSGGNDGAGGAVAVGCWLLTVDCWLLQPTNDCQSTATNDCQSTAASKDCKSTAATIVVVVVIMVQPSQP